MHTYRLFQGHDKMSATDRQTYIHTYIHTYRVFQGHDKMSATDMGRANRDMHLESIRSKYPGMVINPDKELGNVPVSQVRMQIHVFMYMYVCVCVCLCAPVVRIQIVTYT